MQRRNRGGSVSAAQRVLKTADSECVDAMADILVDSSNVSSDDRELSLVDMSPHASMAHSDHVYCRTEHAADEQTSPTELTVDTESPILVQQSSSSCESKDLNDELSTVFYHASDSYSSSHDSSNLKAQPLLKDIVTDTEPTLSALQQSSCVTSESEELDDELSNMSYTAARNGCSSSSDDTSNNTKSDLSHCPSAATVQSLDALVSNSPLELDVADTEDVSLGSSATSGISVSDTVGIVSQDDDDASCITKHVDNGLVSEVSEGIDLRGDGSVELEERQYYSDPTDSCTVTVSQNDEASGGAIQLAADDCMVTVDEVVDTSDGRSVELECQCGAQCNDPVGKLHVVECQRCHSYQHAACVNYDLADPLRGDYLCPHCHAIEVRHIHTYVFSSLNFNVLLLLQAHPS